MDFQCPICLRHYPDAKKLRLHNRMHREKTHECSFCPKKFLHKYQLRDHVTIIHDRIRPFICDNCNTAFSTKQSLERHMITHNQQFPHKCDICKAGYAAKRELERHRDAVHFGVRHSCEYCPKSFRNYLYFKQHLKQHLPGYSTTKSKHHCPHPDCDKSFINEKTLNRHFKKHTGTFRSYICDICGKVLSCGSNLKYHMRIHTGERPYVCETCGSSFAKKEILVTHRRVHTKERPYACDVCLKTFTQKQALNVHMRYHTGDKPHKCDICCKRFVSKALLRQHKCRMEDF